MANYPEIKLLIGGEWHSRAGDPIINPADESVSGTVPHATTEDLEAAASAAADGFRLWRRTSPARRGEVILRAVQLIRERVDEIAATMTLEQGKPLVEARTEVLRAADIIEWDANEGKRVYGRIVPGEPGLRNSVIRQPIGVVAGFSPWNFPFISPARKVGGALSAGCAIILKAAEETPGGAYHLARAFVDAGLPAGVLNLVYGVPSQVSEYLIPHPAVRMITFTGSIPVGKHLAEMAARYMKPAIMELGGHAPVIICDDVDPEATAAVCVAGKARNAGQICVSPTRFFVEEAIYERFATAFGEKAAALRIGNGLESTTQMGPLSNSRRIDAMDTLVADAREKGARVLSGGARMEGNGYYYPLTVVADVPEEARAMQEEPFGPLALITPVRNLDEALEKANALEYGLAGYAFTTSAAKAERLAERLEVGNLAINHFTASLPETPFGGIKESGYGREGGVEGLECYTVVKAVSHLTTYGVPQQES